MKRYNNPLQYLEISREQHEEWLKSLKEGDEVLVWAESRWECITIVYKIWSRGGIYCHNGGDYSPCDGREVYDDLYFCDLCGLKEPKKSRYANIYPPPVGRKLMEVKEEIERSQLRLKLLRLLLEHSPKDFHELHRKDIKQFEELIESIEYDSRLEREEDE